MMTGFQAEENLTGRAQKKCAKNSGRYQLGVGYNTPAIIKFPFWQAVKEDPRAVYACVNMGEAYCPQEIAQRSVCIDGDIGEVLQNLF